MKKISKLLILLVTFFAVTSCSEFLNRDPQSVISEEDAFKNFINFQGYTEELYHCIPNFTNRYHTNSFNWGEDEIQSTANTFHFIVKIENGDFWGWQAQHDGWSAGWLDRNGWSTNGDRFTKGLWPLAWFGIRKANMGLENIDKLTSGTQEERDLIKGQLLFFRGWFHHQLMQYFGGLPYIDTVLPGDQKLTLPRLSYQETALKAAEDFRQAADLLPIDWDNTTAGRRTLGKNQLRINKIMALGYLGKNYLWAASPLMNSVSGGGRTYNKELSQKSAEAFAELLNLCESGQTPYKLLPFAQYSTNFYTTGQNWAMPGGTEAIFRGPYFDANGSNWSTSKQYSPGLIQDGDVKFLPTANYVDYYGMANGLPIKDGTKADPENGYDPQYPWKNRDPRFYHDIIFDGTKMVAGTIPNTAEEVNRYANLHTGGSYRNIVTGSRTGYLMYKFVPRGVNKYDNAHDYSKSLNIYVPYMRLADVYLMYAEAAAQAYGSANGKASSYSKTALDAINVIRDRAGVGRVDSRFTGSLDVFMEELRRERAVELSFEGHRFNDLRRWLLLIESPYTLKKSVEFDRAAPIDPNIPAEDRRVLNYRYVTILERKFEQKHYWLPLKNNDANLYLEFAQNPGW